MEKKESCGIMAIDLKSFYASCECVERGLDWQTEEGRRERFALQSARL